MPKRTWKRRKNAQLGLCPTPDQLWRRIEHTITASLLCSDEAFSAALAIRNGEPLIRAELEARILAAQTPAVIAPRMSIPVDVITEFEFWHFDVRGRLETPSWIAQEAIRRHPSGELSSGDIGPFWRWLGFNLGAGVLESFLLAVSTKTLLREGLDAYWKRETALDVDLKLLVIAGRLAVPRTQTQLAASCCFQDVLLSVKDLHTGDLLCPLNLEMSPFSGPEIDTPSIESQSSNAFDPVDGRSTVFDVKPNPVVQSLVA